MGDFLEAFSNFPWVVPVPHSAQQNRSDRPRLTSSGHPLTSVENMEFFFLGNAPPLQYLQYCK
jgi:hypothetical protein